MPKLRSELPKLKLWIRNIETEIRAPETEIINAETEFRVPETEIMITEIKTINAEIEITDAQTEIRTDETEVTESENETVDTENEMYACELELKCESFSFISRISVSGTVFPFHVQNFTFMAQWSWFEFIFSELCKTQLTIVVSAVIIVNSSWIHRESPRSHEDWNWKLKIETENRSK